MDAVLKSNSYNIYNHKSTVGHCSGYYDRDKTHSQQPITIADVPGGGSPSSTSGGGSSDVGSHVLHTHTERHAHSIFGAESCMAQAPWNINYSRSGEYIFAL